MIFDRMFDCDRMRKVGVTSVCQSLCKMGLDFYDAICLCLLQFKRIHGPCEVVIVGLAFVGVNMHKHIMSPSYAILNKDQ